MADDKKPPMTREQVESLLAELQARATAQDAEIAALKAEKEQRAQRLESELAQAKLDLAAAQRNLDGRAAGPQTAALPKMIPYKGLVRAIENCFYGQYRFQGDVFEVEVAALWTDDPYEAVVQTGTRIDKEGLEVAVYGPNDKAPTPIPFRGRPKGDFGTSLEQRRAGTF